MNSFQKIIGRTFTLALVLFLTVFSALAQQTTGTLRGQVVDEFGGAIVGATVTATDASGAAKTATTNNEGNYTLAGLAPGKYVVRVSATGFAVTEEADVEVAAGRREPLNVTLKVTIEEQKVTVAAEQPISTEPQNNADQVLLTGKDLDALPDDPDELAAALQALAGPSAGPNGGQIFIDGFTGGRLPPKESIREIRINQNPFAAENDQPAGGRIDIFTKPGTDKIRGSAFLNFNDESLNSRNPFSTRRPPFQVRQYGGNLSGPIIARKASFFMDFERREIDDNELVRATILDPSFNPVIFGEGLLVPRRFVTFSPRLDYQLNAKNTLVARYTYNHSSTENGGVGGFSLPERAFDSSNTQQTVQLTNTSIISPTVINETRFQYIRSRNQQLGDNTLPSISVADAFTGGGSQVGQAFTNEDRWELQNYVTWAHNTHSIKAGVRLRGVKITDVSPNNFGGAYTFTGGVVPQLDANNNPVLDANGNPIPVSVSSLERYRRTLVLEQQGLTPLQVRALGGGASQFSINGGNPQADVKQTDAGIFFQDDWRVRPELTVSLGLRYERQTNINSKYNFAPRLAFAWSPGGGNSARPPKMVIRGGGGIFYNRFNESNTLRANRFNGTNQQQFITSEQPLFINGQYVAPTTLTPLDAFPNVPTNISLSTFSQTTWRVADNLEAPTVYLYGLQVERQLPRKFTTFVGYFHFNIKHVIRARDINAPLPGTFTPGNPNSGVRPFGNVGEIYQYESSGNYNQTQLFIGVNNRLNPKITLFASYVLSKTTNDTDGQGGGLFPANSYDLTTEPGRAAFDIRHRFTLAGTFTMPKKFYSLTFNPFIVATSGRPFNIVTGVDTNGDRLFLERPAFAGASADCSNPAIRCTSFGNFNINPQSGDTIIPRNYGQSPGFFSVNVRVSKTWNFGEVHSKSKAAASSSTQPQQTAGGQSGGANRGGGRGPGAVPGFSGGGGGGQG
ncbi:MAG: TonB-dependent receptor, partial [Pyrinomonadaceae bacterium]